MVNTVKIPRAYSEVYSFLNTLGSEYIYKIPEEIYNTVKENRDKEYNPVYQKEQTLKEGMLSIEALSLIAALNLQYWCSDEEKKELKEKYLENTKNEQKKYSYDNLFKNKKVISKPIEKIVTEEVALVEYKESILKRICNKILSIFKR